MTHGVQRTTNPYCKALYSNIGILIDSLSAWFIHYAHTTRT